MPATSRITAGRRGLASRFGACLAPLLLVLPLLAVGAPRDEIDPLLAAGTLQLALATAVEKQPDPRDDPAGWLAWERERLRLLQLLGDWPQLNARLAAHPKRLPDDFTAWTGTLAAEAALAAGDGALALTRLQALLWSAARGDGAQHQAWRRLVLRSYLQLERYPDAYTALLRYQQDFGLDDPALGMLPARVLFQAGRPDAALDALGDAADGTARALRLLIELQSGREPPESVHTRAVDLATGSDDPADAARAWSVAARAAAAATLPAARIAALEAGLPDIHHVAQERLFAYTATTLWDAYLEYGRDLGNRAQLLVGQTHAWQALAVERAATAPVDGRALHALLAQTVNDPDTRRTALHALAHLLAATPRGSAVLQHLYLDTGRADDPGAIPEALREPLAEQALAAGEFQRALRLISGLEPPPATLDGIELRLRRARIRVLSGDQERGTAELTLLLDTFPEVFAEQPDRMLAVIENLRGRGAHGPAIALLQRWLPALDLEARHDLHLLIAASELARNRPLPAARHFLLAEAAGSADGPAHDYRRQAVRALLRAGLFNDARQLLEGELAATSDAARRAAIERELRSLR